MSTSIYILVSDLNDFSFSFLLINLLAVFPSKWVFLMENSTTLVSSSTLTGFVSFYSFLETTDNLYTSDITSFMSIDITTAPRIPHISPIYYKLDG